MELSTTVDNASDLHPVRGRFQTSSAKGPRRSKQGTFSHAVRTNEQLCPKSSGPEFYSQHASFVWQHGSISKKGYGAGFVSQTPRLGTSFKYTGPGPGPLLDPQDLLCSASIFLAAIGLTVVQVHTGHQAGATSFTVLQNLASSSPLPRHRYSQYAYCRVWGMSVPCQPPVLTFTGSLACKYQTTQEGASANHWPRSPTPGDLLD